MYSFLLMDIVDLSTLYGTSCCLVGPKFEFERIDAFTIGGLELPFFHCIYRSIHKNRVTTDYFGFFHVAIGGDHNVDPDHTREPELSCNVRVLWFNSVLHLALACLFGIGRAGADDGACAGKNRKN